MDMATRKRSNGHAPRNAAREVEQRELICKLTDPEFQDRSDKMAAAELAIEKLKEQRKGINGQIADAAAERARLAHIIDHREEARMVACEWQDDFQRNVKRLVRPDTGAEVDTRPMTAADRQVGLDLPPVDEDAVTVPPAADSAPTVPAKRPRGRPRKTPAPVVELHAH